MQTIDNRTHVWGIIETIANESDMANFGLLTLSIRRTASLPDFPDLLTKLALAELRVHVPLGDLNSTALHVAQSVDLVLQMASRTLAFAQPGTLQATKP